MIIVNRKRLRRSKSHQKETKPEKTDEKLIVEETSETGGVRATLLLSSAMEPISQDRLTSGFFRIILLELRK